MRTGFIMLFAELVYIILNDLFFYLSIKQHLRNKLFRCLYFVHSIIFIIGLFLYHILIPRIYGPELYFWANESASILLLFYIPKSIFIIFNGISLLFRLIKCRLIYIFLRTLAISISLLVFILTFYGITWGRTDYKLEHVNVQISDLPGNFNGFRIIQLSDMHLGSYPRHFTGISKIVDIVNTLQPDLIVFTGDMVNSFSSEIEPWINELQCLYAPFGKYAVTGNHDYGKYVHWVSDEEEQNNLRQFFLNMETAGFTMLNNTNVPLIIGQDTIFLCGVENWGFPPFPQLGKLQKALEGTADHSVILLSHDPSHWHQEVIQYPVDLMLSGHTHAMQIGFQIGNFRWSPCRYIYPEYNGLYSEGYHQLYVSRGAGYIGFAGRIGQRPEITLIEIHK